MIRFWTGAIFATPFAEMAANAAYSRRPGQTRCDSIAVGLQGIGRCSADERHCVGQLVIIGGPIDTVCRTLSGVSPCIPPAS